MTTNSFAKKRPEAAKQPRVDHTPQRSAERSVEHSWSWLVHAVWIGAVGVLAVLWSISGSTTAAGDHCRRNVGSDSCSIAATEPYVTCGYFKCGGLFSDAEESTHERLVREDRMKLAAEKQKRSDERAARALQGELSGDNRRVIGNRMD